MRNRRILLTLLLGCSLPLLAQPAAPDSNHAGLQALIEKVSAALNAKDTRAFGSCFTEDGEFTNPIGTSLEGRSAIEDFHARLFSPTRFPNTPSFYHVRFTVLTTKIRMVRPDVASVDIRWQQEGAIAPDGSPWGTRTGIMSWVAIRDHDTWQIEIWHNMELPKGS